MIEKMKSDMKTVMQQNSCNLTSFNLEILIIWHLNRVVPRLEVLLFARKKLYQLNRQISGYVQNGLQVCLYVNCYGISWPLNSCSINFFCDEEYVQMEYSSDLLCSPSIGAVTKNYL